jgi:hypothetical protein
MKLNEYLDELYNAEATTSVARDEAQEVDQIVRAIDEYIFYDGNPSTKSLAKAAEVIPVLIKILVSNGALTLPQVRRALKNGE